MSSLIANKVKTNVCLVSPSALSYVPLFPTYTTTTACLLYLLVPYTSILLSTNDCALDLYNDDLQTTTVLFIRNFTPGWLNYHHLSSTLSCPFIVQRKLSNERSWSRTFVLPLSRELYCDYIVVCAFAYLSIPFYRMLVVVGILGTCSMYLFLFA